MNDPFYEHEKEVVYTEKYSIPRSVKEIFNHMRDKLDEHDRKYKEDIFSANARRNDVLLETYCMGVNVEDLKP